MKGALSVFYMDYRLNKSAQNYLNEFDEILLNMANRMLNPTLGNSVTINFIRCMIPHHEAAIYMCENLLRYTSFLPLKEEAKSIIKMQTRGVAQMKEIEQTTKYLNCPPNFNQEYLNEYFKITKNMIFRMSNSLRSNNINLDFVSEMIPHHEGAIQMCQNLLGYNIDPRLRLVAENIIKEQSEGVQNLYEIRQMLLRKYF